MDEIKVSVIMPVYNSAKYLRQTLNSIVNQSFRDFELIVINDGSTDGSLEILDEYRNEIEKMKILNQRNLGVSIARNNGIKVAHGRYISFLDSDDILHPDFLRILFDGVCEAGADIIYCKYDTFHGFLLNDFQSKMDVNFQYLEGQDMIENFEIAMKKGCGTSPCIKLYKKEILDNYHIVFNPISSYGEDMFFNLKAFLASQKICYTEKSLYYYRQDGDSATTRYHAKLFETYSDEFNGIREFAKEHNFYNEKLEIALRCNFIERIPAIIRMELRKSVSLYQKYKSVKELLEKSEVRHCVDIYLNKNDVQAINYKLAKRILNKQYIIILFSNLYLEMRIRIGRKIKRYWQFRKADV